MAVVGLGIDICSVDRIRRILAGRFAARFVARVYTDAEQTVCQGRSDAAAAYAARFAAKEALVKALGAPPGIRWRDMEVTRTTGAPSFNLRGEAQRVIEARRVCALLSITHDAGIAAAAVVLEERL